MLELCMSTPKKWIDAIAIPIPKKGGLRNHSGVVRTSLLTVGKMTAAKQIAEGGRTGVNMTFTVRQLVEKSTYNTKLYLILLT